MSKLKLSITTVVMVLVSMFALAGCGDSPGAPRITGLSPDGVVRTVFNEVQANQMSDAKEYLAPGTTGDNASLKTMRNSNLINAKTVANQSGFAVVVATVMQQNTNNISVKPVGLEKINGEWCILDINNIYNNTKYTVLQRLLGGI